jgi:parallel beta-helix repeat protein
MITRFAMISGIGLLLLTTSPAPASAAPAPIKCGATIIGAAVLTADLVCPSGHGLVVVGRSAALDCAGHRITGGDRTGQYGIYVRDGAGAVVRNCVAERFEVGIRVRGMQGGVLKKNVAQDNLRYGIEVTQGSTAMRIQKNLVLDNGDEGIHLSGPDNVDAAHAIVDNTVGGNALEGIYLLGSHGNLIAGNTVRDHGAAGIYVKDSDRNRLDANTLINDPIHLVYGSTQNVLTDNTIVGQQIRFKEASDNQVHRMTVRTEGGRPSVAYELMSSARNVIADSQVTAPSGYDIRATTGSTGNVFTRFSVTSILDCSVDASSSVRVSNGGGAALACGK